MAGESSSSSLKRKGESDTSHHRRSKKPKNIDSSQRSVHTAKANGTSHHRKEKSQSTKPNAKQSEPIPAQSLSVPSSAASKSATNSIVVSHTEHSTSGKNHVEVDSRSHDRKKHSHNDKAEAKRVKSHSTKDADRSKKHKKSDKSHHRSKEQIAQKPRRITLDDEDIISDDDEAQLMFHSIKETSDSILRSFTANDRIWKLAQGTCGRFSEHAPLLSHNEKFLLASTDHSVNIYDTQTSLLEAFLPDITDTLSSFTFSAQNPSLLYVTTANTIDLWNWTNATQIGSLTANFTSDNAICLRSSTSDEDDLLFTVSFAGKWGITVHRFVPGDDKPYKESFPVLSTEDQITDFRVLYGGAVLILKGETSVMVGLLKVKSSVRFDDWDYDWQEILCDESPMTLEIRASGDSEKLTDNVVDLAIGGSRGSIYVYRNMLHTLFASPDRESVSPQRLHWHREGVPGLAWSKDGNYIISGGSETVLVLWQLETGQKQLLPHLESPIRSLSVSESGTSYIIRLADNSIMILSTAELEPTTNITNLQTLSISSGAEDVYDRTTVDDYSSVRNDQPDRSVRACIRSGLFNDVLFAVPSSQKSSTMNASVPASPYLQRFDLSNERHLSRQALTRTNATTVNRSPEGLEIPVPDVKHMAVSSDGFWLATVDEWSPPVEDVVDMQLPESKSKLDGARHRDVTLRFWKWHDETEQWQLVSRIATPHPLGQHNLAGRILSLISNPTEAGFVTAGEDGVLCQWSLKSRLPNGRTVRGASTKAKDTWWAAGIKTDLPRTHIEDPSTSVIPSRITASFSEDGSCIAVNQHFAGRSPRENNIVHFVNPSTGMIAQSRDDLFTDLITKTSDFVTDLQADQIAILGLLDSFLILVGTRMTAVWDLPSMTLHRVINTLPIRSPLDTLTDPEEIYSRTGITTPASSVPLPKLSLNHSTKTFAIAAQTLLWDPENGNVPLLTGANARNPLRTHTSVVSVYALNGRKKDCLFQETMPKLVLSLLAADGSTPQVAGSDASVKVPGFIVIDAGASLRRIVPTGVMDFKETKQNTTATEEQAASDPVDEVNGVNAEMDGSEDEEMDVDDTVPALEVEAADRAVVPQQRLAAVFDHPPHAMPSVLDMFNDVVRLYAPKSVTA